MQYEVTSPCNEELMKLFHRMCQERGIVHSNGQIFEYLRTFGDKTGAEQLSLFD